MRNVIVLSACAAATAFLAPALASAQSYGDISQECQQSLNNNRLAGGTIGAIAGAVLGKQIAGRNARTEGQVLGAVVGAVAGSELGRGRIACDDGAYQTQSAPRKSAYRNNDYGYRHDYANSNYNSQRHYSDQSYYEGRGNYGGNYGNAYQASYRPPVVYRQQCGWGEKILRAPNGQYQSQNIWMCQANNGQWYPASR
jgi:hypothetical protein